MSKVSDNRFLTYEQQIQKLVTDKELIINNESFAVKALTDIGYFSLIGGYKVPFRNPMTRKYINTTFEDVFALYKFDRGLREVTFRYLCEVEQKIRQVTSYCFCEVHGDDQAHYTSVTSYNPSPKFTQEAIKLTHILDNIASKSTDHDYLVHQRKVHGNVPLWVTMNALTFGQVSKFYMLLPFSIQSKIAKSYPFVNEKGIERYLKCMTLFRNICAHNERLYCFRLQIDFPDTILHQKLKLPKKGTQYTQGKQDYFGLVIAFRYLLNNDSFKHFKYDLTRLINAYCKESSRLSKEDLFSIMGFPENWRNITFYTL